MKKTVAFLLTAGMLIGFTSCGGEPVSSSSPETTATTASHETTPPETSAPHETTAKPNTPETGDSMMFDEKNIAFSFAALSDMHIGNSTTDDPAVKLQRALDQLKREALLDDANGLDAVLVAGDLTNSGASGYGNQKNQILNFKAIYEKAFDPKKTPMVFCAGNHDAQWSGSSIFEAEYLNAYLGEDYFLCDVDKEAIEEEGNRHAIVNGYHVLTVLPVSQGPVSFTEETKQWLDNTLSEITKEDPNSFVFVLSHAMIYDTVYGSDLVYGNIGWFTEDLTEILSKYSQVVTLSGHLHFPLQDPRTIMQTAFTSLGCGSVRYMAIENGGYEEMASATTMQDKDDISNGLLVQLDGNGNMRVRRLDFMKDAAIGEDYIVPHPTADGAHLTKYGKNRGDAEQNTAPILTTLDAVFGAVDGTKQYVTVKFDAGTDDAFVHHYVLTVGKKGGATKTYKLLSDFYRHPKSQDMKKTWERGLGSDFAVGETYVVTLTAYDSWGAVSNTLTKEFTPDGKAPEASTTAEELPQAYADLDFSGTRITDKMGNVSVTNYGGLCGNTSVTFGGVTKSMPAFRVQSSGAYALCTLNHLGTASEMKAFAEGGFALEAFYVMGKKGGVQGIVCGTQEGGFGLAESSGKPYFIVGKTGGKYNTGAYANVASSAVELVHVVGVYDYAAKKVKVYINGILNSTQEIGGEYCPGAGDAYNKFCLGMDVRASGLGGDYPSPDLTLVSARIYSAALTDGQVLGAYQNAAALFE